MSNHYQDTLDFTTFKSKVETLGAKVQKLDIIYNQSDSRVWTAIVNPSNEVLMVTGHINRVLANNPNPFNMGNKSFDIISSSSTNINVHPEEIYDTITDLLEEKEIVQPNEVEA
jgi:hypothetical protein